MSEKPLKLQRPYRDEEARANLLSYINSQDRGGPPVFVGRQDIFQHLTQDVEECRSNTRGSTCYTRVIQGAPGAGKTSLIEEIKERLDRGLGESKRTHDAVVVVGFDGGDFFREAFVANQIIEAYTGEDFDVQKEKTSSKGVQAGAGGSHLSYESVSRERSLEQQIQSAGSLWKPVIDNIPVDKDETVFIFLIDEAQNIRGVDNEDGKNHIVMNLHNGFDTTRGLKIVPVFVGLSDTKSELKKRGVSRLPRSSSLPLGSLTQDESEELVSGWMHHEPFGFENLFSSDDISRVSKMIAVASEGWPRHANTYLSELARSVLEYGAGDSLMLDLDEVFGRGHEHRLTFYGERVSSAGLGTYEDVIRAVTKQSTDGVVLRSTLRTIAQDKYHLPALGIDALHEKAVGAGIIEQISEYDSNQFHYPIPSFYTYMQCDLAHVREEFLRKMRQQMDAHSHLWSEPKGLTR